MIDPNLHFIESSHQYFYDDVEQISATTLIKSYSRPFDKDKVSASTAEKNGSTQEHVLKMWDEKNRRSSGMGNEIHDFAERVINDWKTTGRMIVPKDAREIGDGRALGVVDFLFSHPEIAQGIMEAEARVCHPEFGVAGTVDFVAGNLDGVPTIVDWKSNLNIDVIGGSDNMYWPLNHLPDSNYYAYALQLSLYARILRDRYDFDAQQLVLVWVKPGGAYERFDINERHEEIDKILKKGPRARRKK